MADPGPSYSCTSHKLNVSKDIGWNSVDSPFLYQFLRPERAIRAGSGGITPLPYTYLYPRGSTLPDTPFSWRFTCLKSGYSKCGSFLGLKNLPVVCAAYSTAQPHTRFLNSLRNSNRRIHRAWVLKDEFERIWNYSYRASAEKFLKRWITAALRSRIPSLRQFVGTVRNHFDNIVAFTDRNLTNAVGEGLNRIVKIVKNRASGYRNLDNFADMIFLTVGDLDIPAHIPSHLRTL